MVLVMSPLTPLFTLVSVEWLFLEEHDRHSTRKIESRVRTRWKRKSGGARRSRWRRNRGGDGRR
jgi:hypothetical protein